MANGPFGNCKIAELHKTDKIQSYGCMLVIDRQTNTLIACSDNVERFLSLTSDNILGRHWDTVLQGIVLAQMREINRGQDLTMSRMSEAKINGKSCIIAHHSVNECCIVEIEWAKDTQELAASHEKAEFINKLKKATKARDCARILMDKVATLIDFDRVLLYEFLPEWHGEVIAEVLKPRIEGFLGLRFPASDVPANARRVYTLNQQRLIASVVEPTSSLVFVNNNIELDLTWSQLRAVHPVHIQYLKNLAVEASFSVSLVCNGQLWGLLACHNMTAKYLSFETRQLCEELSQITSLHMSGLLRAEIDFQRYHYKVEFAEIRGAMQSSIDAFKAIKSQISEIKTLLNADGIWHHIDGEDYYHGQVPDELSLSLLGNWLAQFDRHQVMSRHTVVEDFKQNKALVKFASGLLFLPLNQQNFIVLFRREEIETVNWAGKPQSHNEQDMSTSALTPRNSFLTWAEVMGGQAKPWNLIDIEMAEDIRCELVRLIEKNQLEIIALKDPLTGIANRLMFERKLKSALQQALEANQQFAIYMIDLDRFKPVNDTYGHAVGDELLIQVTQRLQALLRCEDMVARLGGDEFAVIQLGISNKGDIERIAKLMVEEVKRPFLIEGKNIEIGASIGITICPLDAISQTELLLGADLALYEVKKSGRNGFKHFEPSMLLEKTNDESIRNQLLRAFENKELEMVYQPIIDSRSKKIVGLEAFTRWQHPVLGFIAAQEFVSAIDKNHLNPEFVDWMLMTTFSDYQQWQRQGIASIPVSINLRSDQFLSLDIENKCRALSQQYQVATTWLRIDLDEPTLAIDANRSEIKINALAQHWILCNIDHFGQGLLSLKQLTKLKVNSLKIDSRLLMDDKKNIKTQALATILKAIGEVMNVPVVATRVEKQEVMAKAKSMGINLVQGFAIIEPMSVADVSAYMTK